MWTSSPGTLLYIDHLARWTLESERSWPCACDAVCAAVSESWRGALLRGASFLPGCLATA